MFLSAETFWAVLLSPVQPRLGAETAKAVVFDRILRHLYLPLPRVAELAPFRAPADPAGDDNNAAILCSMLPKNRGVR